MKALDVTACFGEFGRTDDVTIHVQIRWNELHFFANVINVVEEVNVANVIRSGTVCLKKRIFKEQVTMLLFKKGIKVFFFSVYNIIPLAYSN